MLVIIEVGDISSRISICMLYIAGVGEISSRISGCMLPLLGSPVIQVRQLAGIMHTYHDIFIQPNNGGEDPDLEFFTACKM